MLRQWKKMLITGSLLFCTFCMPVQAATLEDSMLKPSSDQTEESEDDTKETSSFSSGSTTITTAAELVDLSQDERVQHIGEMCREDYENSGVLASVSAAQCILESGYLMTTLATDANNCFGMKATLSGNDWEGSTWDGVSIYTKQTGEEYNGQDVTITADFRQYDCVEDSVADHSAYLLGATVDGGNLRYAGLKGETDYRKAIQIIRDGGYATDSSYVDKICSIIERFDLTQFDQIEEDSDTKKADTEKAEETKAQKKAQKQKAVAAAKSASDTQVTLYRIRKSWEDSSSQIGAFQNLENAKAACKDGYHIYDSQGNEVE